MEGIITKGNIQEGTISRKLSFMTLTARVLSIGSDYCILVSGGDSPHIGCTVLAVPRSSLTGNGKQSSTSSVINVTGHKDEAVCRYIAEQAAAATGSVVVCSGGIHVDGITKGQIDELMEAVEDMIGTDR